MGSHLRIGQVRPQPPSDDRVAQLAARQHGNVTHAQLRDFGLSDNAILHRVQKHRLFRIYKGVYAVGRRPATPIERASAAVLACGPTAALSHLAALKLWGLAPRWPRSFDVTVSAGDPRPKGITVHRSRTLARGDVRVQLGIPATSPARTVVDCARLLAPKTRTRTVHDALRSPALTEAQLSQMCARLPGHPGARLVSEILSDIDGAPTRSDFERLFLDFCERFGLPQPRTNVRVAGHEADIVFVEERVIVELDGWRFHRDREAFEADRDRDADMLALADCVTVRITWKRFKYEPAREAARLDRILARRRRRG